MPKNNNNPPRLVPVHAHDTWNGMFRIVAAAQGQAPGNEQPAQASRPQESPPPARTQAPAQTCRPQSPTASKPRKA